MITEETKEKIRKEFDNAETIIELAIKYSEIRKLVDKEYLERTEHLCEEVNQNEERFRE